MNEHEKLVAAELIIGVVANGLIADRGTTLAKKPIVVRTAMGNYVSTVVHAGHAGEFEDQVLVLTGRQDRFVVKCAGGYSTYDRNGKTLPDIDTPEFDEAIAQIRGEGTPEI